MMRAVLAGSMLLSLGAASAPAAECPIERAVYREGEQSSELRFAPVGSESGPVTHAFTLAAGRSTAEGQIYYDLEIERPVAVILKNCPEGDVTGADLAACTVWKGIIYGVDKASAHVDLLPVEGDDAPDQLLLPGFGPAVLASSIGKAVDGMPWDVFSYKECAPKA